MRILILIVFVLQQGISYGQVIDKSYQNFDFVAGEKTIFDGNLLDGAKDKMDQRWILDGGAISVIPFEDQKCISIDAYYTKLFPVLFNAKVLPDSFSIEYDTWLDAGYDGNPGIEIHLKNNDNEVLITPNKHSLTVSYPDDGKEMKDNPDDYFGEDKFYNKWIHISISMYKAHLVVYLDQYKMIDIPDSKIVARSLIVTGNSSQDMKMLFKNFRIAKGFPGQVVFKDNKFITHAIKFDVNKTELRPESITVIKEIFAYLQKNKTERVEIGGHTDSDGSPEYNAKLSQLRAEAVMNQLVSMGIGKDQLIAKGYGSTKPLETSNTAEAKAMNRRVEFTKQ
jgi:OmpA-OmpF porin, OOP family